MSKKTDAVVKFLQMNPEAPYSQYCLMNKVGVSDAFYYSVRRDLKRKGTLLGLKVQKDSAWDSHQRPDSHDKHEIFKGPGGSIRMLKKSAAKYREAFEYIQKRPDASYKEVIDAVGVKIGEGSMSKFRKKLGLNTGSRQGPRSYTPRQKNPMYFRIFSMPSKDIGPQAKEVLKKFLEVLRETKVARYELVEYTDPQQEIEIREVR